MGLVLFVLYERHESNDPQGQSNEHCVKVDLPAVNNNDGLVVTGHNTACDALGGTSAVYLYLHKQQSPEDSGSLVLRYFENYNSGPPKTRWASDSKLLISVGHISQITKLVTQSQGVTIVYDIAKEDYPRKTT
jgi:hypothetical protein